MDKKHMEFLFKNGELEFNYGVFFYVLYQLHALFKRYNFEYPRIQYLSVDGYIDLYYRNLPSGSYHITAIL